MSQCRESAALSAIINLAWSGPAGTVQRVGKDEATCDHSQRVPPQP